MLQLVLRDNDLIELPKALGNLARLKELHLQNNRLTALPPELGMLILFSHEQNVTCSVQQTMVSRLWLVLSNRPRSTILQKRLSGHLTPSSYPACFHFCLSKRKHVIVQEKTCINMFKAAVFTWETEINDKTDTVLKHFRRYKAKSALSHLFSSITIWVLKSFTKQHILPKSLNF